jgi:integrase
MSVLFNHACRYELFDGNPIKLVRQSAKRRTAPNVLIPAEIKLLLDNLELRERTLVLLAVSTGLRQSELFALKWGDINFSQGTMKVTRSIAYGIVGRYKTEASQKPVPVHPILAAALIHWRDRSRVPASEPCQQHIERDSVPLHLPRSCLAVHGKCRHATFQSA